MSVQSATTEFDKLFASPLRVKSDDGSVSTLDVNPDDLRLFNVLLPTEDVPLAFVGLTNGGLSFVRFDSDPPTFAKGMDAAKNGRKVSKEEFVRLVKTARAAR